MIIQARNVVTFDWSTFDFELFRGDKKTLPIGADLLLCKANIPPVFLSAVDLAHNYLPGIIAGDIRIMQGDYYETANGVRDSVPENLLVVQLTYPEEDMKTYLFRFGMIHSPTRH
jgi:hypothetical protein